MATFSKTQIDKLGDRLRRGSKAESDVRELDLYRRSFASAYDVVVGRIRGELGLEPTGRPAKSTSSIVEKLQRESIRLSQVQDIAGCRLVLPDIAAQNLDPSHGYRAVHVVVSVDDRFIEVQVRTSLQHLWAELSEKIADVRDPIFKYGGGTEPERSLLDSISATVSRTEAREREETRGLPDLENRPT